MIKAPCKNCPDRTIEPNCHMTCERYLAFIEEKRTLKEARKKDEYIFTSREYKRRKLLSRSE